MARTVFFHVGLPKTGTTYLQTILWNNRAELRGQGILLPGFGPRASTCGPAAWSARSPNLDRRHPDAPTAWDVLRDQVNPWDGTAVISHEFFAGATAGAGRPGDGRPRGAEVHVVVTARDTLSLVTARWQEFVKNGATGRSTATRRVSRPTPPTSGTGASMDVADVLRRWSTAVPARAGARADPAQADRAPRDALAALRRPARHRRRRGATRQRLRGQRVLGVVEVELLRRVNADLEGFGRAVDRGVWIRGYLAQGKLVPAQGREVLALAGRGSRGFAGGKRARSTRSRPRLRRDRRPRSG